MLQFKVAEKAQHFTKLSIISHGSFDQGPADLKDLRATTDHEAGDHYNWANKIKLQTDKLLVGGNPF